MSSADKELTNIETLLRGMQPAPANLNRDQLMFAAGAASVQAVAPVTRTPWYWPAATFASTTLAGMLALLLLRGPTERVEYVNHPANQAPSPATVASSIPNDASPPITFASNSVFRLRELAINDHWDWSNESAREIYNASHLPTTTPMPKTYRQMLEESLDSGHL